MKPLIGTLTAGIALSDINEATELIGNKCEVLYLSYQSYEQAEEVLTNHIKRLDGIIYGGYRSYRVAPPPGDQPIPFEVLRIGRADFFELFLRVIVVDKVDITRISVDFLDERDLYGGLRDYLKSHKMPYVYSAKGEFPMVKDILAFHLDLYRQGKIDCVITTLPSVAKELKQQGIQYYYIQPSVDTIAEALESVTNRALANTLTGGLAVLGIVIAVKGDYSRLYPLLSEFATTHCSHMVVNRNEYNCHLITQNRYFNELTHGYTREVLAKWLREKGIEARIGWGIGKSLSAAAENAAVALEQSSSLNYTCSYIANEDGLVTGPIEGAYCFRYSREATAATALVSERTGLSVMYIQKLRGMWENLPDTPLGCEEIGQYLNISRRSANRVLNQLEESGYAVVQQTPQKGTRGRPIKRYTLHFE